MRFRRRRQDDSADVDMTPMLDIVFIMLIFFIVSAVFLDESGIDLTEPPDVKSPPTEQQAILVQVDAKDEAFVDGKRTQLASVPARIEALRASQPTAPVSVRADAEASLEAVVFLKDSLDAVSVPVSIRVDR